jgi:hypothetical protein
MDMVLVRPDGVEITPSDAATDPDIDYVKSTTYAYYTLNNPMEGEWQTKVTGTDIPPDGSQYNLNVSATSEVSTNFLAFEPSYNPGDPVLIKVSLRKKVDTTWEPILGATADAEITRPNASIDNVTLNDNGTGGDEAASDGVYSATYINTNLGGSYLITANASGTLSPTDFTAQVKKTIQVGNIAQQLSIDPNSLLPVPDSTINETQPLISATIIGPNSYIDVNSIELKLDGNVVPHLYNSVNQVISYTPPSPLVAGQHSVELSLQDSFGRPVSAAWLFNVFQAGIPTGSARILGWLKDGRNRFNVIAVVSCDQGVVDRASRLEYTDSQARIKLRGTSAEGGIDSFSRVGNAVTFGGSCTVNHRPGYTFTATATDGNPDTFGISINGPGGFSYSKSGTFHGKLIVKDTPGAAAPQMTLLPQSDQLEQNYPNPFNPETWIPYQLAQSSEVTISIYNMTGQLIRIINLGEKPAGFYISREKAAYWDGRNVQGEQAASGIYFYQLQTEDSILPVKKMVIVR